MHEIMWGLAIAMLVSAVTARGAEKEDLSCLPPKAGERMFHAYLLGECQKHFDARRKTIDAFTTADQVLARQKEMRAKWLAAVGPFPERTPLNAKVTGTFERDGYRVEKVIYESRPNHHVTACLYIPTTGKPPYPAILNPSGHNGDAKAGGGNQEVAMLAAKNGFVALSYDPIGQGERVQTLDANGKPLMAGTTEHTQIDIGARLVGLCTAHYRIWDGVRSLDYLLSRPEVDPKRIGVTGCSGGGTLTSYLLATDDRLVVGAPSCYITSLERLFATIGPQDGEQNIPNQVADGIEHADYLMMHAPNPRIILAASKDFFDQQGTWATFREAKRLYTLLGLSERVDICEVPGGHGYPKAQREAMIRWMRRWLQGKDEPVTEPDLKPEAEKDLWATKTGQVVSELKGVTVWDLNLQRAKALATQREAFWKDNPRAKCLAEVRRLAGVRAVEPKPTVRTVGRIEREACSIEKLLIERPDEVPMPALLFVPKAVGGRPGGVLYVDGRGKATDAAPGGPIDTLVKANCVVLSIDVRGCGETAPAKPQGYWHNEFPLAHITFHLGRPWLGQRVEDALAALGVLAERPEVDPAKLSIVGVEKGGPVALHAAALDERLREATIEQAIESWMEVVATPQAKAQLNQVVPGALACYDLPDLVKAIAPRKVTVRQAVDAMGKTK
ncbi:MAG TPA: acetylxylan esterase [Planctomycetota bacterium]|mgnify:FL=1|nr:acetylxylan esterase [Planctomycetota bacterium]HRR79942.1 acetylxylan esterase [Planctomycetota bacterium]